MNDPINMRAIRAAWPSLSHEGKVTIMAKHSRLYRYESIEHYCKMLTEEMPSQYRNIKTAAPARRLREGNHKAALEAQKIIEAMQDQGVFTQSARFVKPHYSGMRPNISAVVSGQPKSMYRRRIPGASRSGPITFYVDLVVSGGVSNIPNAIFKRGVAIMALVLAMRRFRPCSVYAFDGTDRSVLDPNRYNIVPAVFYATAIEPTDMARACEMFTNRDVPFGPPAAHAKWRHNAELTWAWGLDPRSRLYKDASRKVLGMQPQDLFITGGYLFDKLMLTDPVAWVKRQIAIHNGLEHEDIDTEASSEGAVTF